MSPTGRPVIDIKALGSGEREVTGHRVATLHAHARGFFVTGTDTGVGKTLVACALLHAFAARGLTRGRHEAGRGGRRARGRRAGNDDVEQLARRRQRRGAAEHSSILIASRRRSRRTSRPTRAGVTIDLDRIARVPTPGLTALADVVIVEGVGGFRVPLGPGVDTRAARRAARAARGAGRRHAARLPQPCAAHGRGHRRARTRACGLDRESHRSATWRQRTKTCARSRHGSPRRSWRASRTRHPSTRAPSPRNSTSRRLG